MTTPSAADPIAVRELPDETRPSESEPEHRPARPWLTLLGEALWPGLGALLRGRMLPGLITMALWPALIITSHMRIVEPSASGPRTAIWIGLLALLWLNAVYRAWAETRAGADEAAVARRLGGSGPSPISWLATRNWLLLAGALFVINRMALDAEVDLREFVKSENLRSVQRIGSGFVHPDFSILKMVITDYAWVTLEMAVIGTLFGALFSAPLSVFGARNLMGRSRATAPVYYVTRFMLSVVRSIPTLVWGLMALSFGLGHFPGVIALSVFSFGLTAKLFSEAIEAIDWGPVEAVSAAGANPLHTLIFGVAPQVIPYFISHLLYCLEVNVHSAVVLGLIGAGGLGLIINEYIATFHWEQAATVLLVTIAMTLAIDYGSAFIRSRVV